MKKIRTADHGLLFLDDEDYMPKLLTYIRETAGHDAADLVEEWAGEWREKCANTLTHADEVVLNAVNRAGSVKRELDDEREEHLREVDELEEELTRLSLLKDIIQAENYALHDLVSHPEKIFPALGTGVLRYKKGVGKEYGVVSEYKMRKNGEFYVKIRFATPVGTRIGWYKYAKLGGNALHFAEEDVRV